MPCSAESANGSPRPSSWYSSASSWRAGLSSLLATSSTGTRERRSRSRQLQIGRAGRGGRVDEQQDEVGLADRELGLADDLALEGAVVARVDAAGVDQREQLAAPLHDHLLAVARDARLRVHDRLARRGEPVDERRLAGVRLAHDRDGAEQRALGLRLGLGGALPRSCASAGLRRSCVSPRVDAREVARAPGRDGRLRAALQALQLALQLCCRGRPRLHGRSFRAAPSAPTASGGPNMTVTGCRSDCLM